MMTNNFSIDVKASKDARWDGPLPLALTAYDNVFTRLIRSGSKSRDPDDYVQAPPIQLAFWLVDNWWRVRWEPVTAGRVSANWKLAHELTAIGGGYAWPRLRLWGESSRIGMSSRADPEQVTQPVRFITNSLVFVSADEFEEVIDRFLDLAADAASDDGEALKQQIRALRDERKDPETYEWRKLEAQLGYDPDDAPEALMRELSGFAEKCGLPGVQEAAVSVQGEGAACSLAAGIEVAEKSKIVFQLEDLIEAAGPVNKSWKMAPWESAEIAASNVRKSLVKNKGPIINKHLGEILNVSPELFHRPKSQRDKLEYGVRLGEDGHNKTKVAIKTNWSQSRRFEACRIVGDAIWSNGELFGPISDAKTARQ